MRFYVLGDLTVETERPRAIGGPQLRRVLAVLLIDAGRTVPSDRLEEIIFGRTHAAGTSTLRSYIARLRRDLVDDEVIGFEPFGQREGHQECKSWETGAKEGRCTGEGPRRRSARCTSP